MVRSNIACAALALALVLLLATSAIGTAVPPSLSGTFKLAAEKCDNIDGAIEHAIAPMSFVVRPFARSRLRVINTPYPELKISSTADDIVMVGDPRAPIRTPTNGTPVEWKREDGEPFTVSGVWDGTVFQQTFASGTGRRVNRYSLSPDGQTLTSQVTVSGGGLPGKLTYQVVYQREA